MPEIESKIGNHEVRLSDHEVRLSVLETEMRGMHKDVGAIKEAVEHNTDRISDIANKQENLHLELVEHRAEFKGLEKGVNFGLRGMMFILTTGLGLIGWLVTR